MAANDFRAQASERVDNSETLSIYRDLLLETDWENEDEHIEWVATAPKAELVDWAQTIRQGEDDLAALTSNQYWQHKTSGERYIVTLASSGKVLAAAGPLPHTEVTQANLDYGFDSDAELVDDLNNNGDDFALVGPSSFFRAG